MQNKELMVLLAHSTALEMEKKRKVKNNLEIANHSLLLFF
jgi:hypothetical protein